MEAITRRYPALKHRDFTLLWIGQLLSFSGSRMQTAAILWHVSLLADPTRKGLALGLVGAAQVVPIIAFHAERRRRRRARSPQGHARDPVGAGAVRRGARGADVRRLDHALADLSARRALLGRGVVRRARAPGADPEPRAA